MKLFNALSSKKGNVEDVRALLESQEEINKIDFDASFMYACQQGELEIIRLLLAQNRIDSKGFNERFGSILQHKDLKNQYQLVELFLNDKLSDNLNLKTFNSVSKLLLEATKYQKLDLFKKLLPLLSESAYAETLADLCASKNDNTELIKLLLADRRPRQSELLSSLEKARDQGNLAHEKLLASAAMPSLYENFVQKMHQSIFIEHALEKNKETYDVEAETKESHTCIYNNDQYINRDSRSNNNKKGKTLFLADEQNTPIGYNIHLPSGPVEAVIVHIYGGSENDKKQVIYGPSDVSDVNQYLLNRNVAVVTLNLPDLLELEVFQGRMPEELHHKIQACINQFYQTITHNPGDLHPDLTNRLDMEGLKVFLHGSSFGGLNTIRHAEMYPDNFTGYISHDGVLSVEMMKKTDISTGAQRAFNSYLDPSQLKEMEKISKPLLITQSRDDNNVNAKVATDFYNKMLELNKSDLVRLLVTETANPGAPNQMLNKGHFAPTDKNEFIVYCESMLGFIKEGPHALPEISELDAYRLDILANKYYKKGTPLEKFNAQALETIEKSLLPENLNPQIIKSMNIHEFIDSSWESEFKPLFCAIVYADKLSQPNERTKLTEELERLKGLLTDEMIIKAIQSQENIFSQYLYESGQLSSGIQISDLITSKEVMQQYKESIGGLAKKQPDVVNNFLSTLYKANPSLIPTFQDKLLEDDLLGAKNKLIKTTEEARAKLLNVYTAIENAPKITTPPPPSHKQTGFLTQFTESQMPPEKKESKVSLKESVNLQSKIVSQKEKNNKITPKENQKKDKSLWKKITKKF